MKHSPPITPRLLRFRDAPRYLGMDRNRFNAIVRPYLTEIRIGKQGIAFDRLELDAWVDRGRIWHIDKRIGGRRLQGSTGTRDLEEAEAVLSHILATHHRAKFYGIRPRRLFREAATKYLEEETKKSLHNDAQALRALDPFIGDLYLEQVHSGTLEPFVKYMRGKSRKAGTINRYIAVVRRILNLAARYWRDADTGLSWLETAPLFRLEKGPQRKPYPISWEEQRLLLSELTPDLARMAPGWRYS
jgi:hypothetical protein